VPTRVLYLKRSVEQPGKSILSKCSGEGKRNSVSHLPLLAGNNNNNNNNNNDSAYDVFGNNKPIFLPKHSNSSMGKKKMLIKTDLPGCSY